MDHEKAQLTSEEINVDIDTSSKDEVKGWKCLSRKWIVIYIVAGLMIFTLFVEALGAYLYEIVYTPEFNNTLPHVNYTSEIDYDYSSVITARLVGHGHPNHLSFNRKTCDDFDYGCCHIYFHCSIKNGYLDYKKYIVSKYKILPKDVIHSNCPSLDHLIHEWNNHYASDTPCEDTEFGCCPSINTACDGAMREKRGNNQETVDYYKQNVAKIHRLRQAKNDAHGSNCPTIGLPTYTVYTILNGWENNYADPDDGLKSLIIIFIPLCLLAASSS